MKKVFKYTETHSWYFELDVDDGAQIKNSRGRLATCF